MKKNLSLKDAIAIRDSYETLDEYITDNRTASHAFVWDGWMGKQNEFKLEPGPKPKRPENYKELTHFWELVDIDKDFNGYPEEKKLHLILEQEFYYAPDKA